MQQLGLMHATGTGVHRNCEQAVGLFKNVAERGHWTQMYADAYDAFESGKIDSAALMYMHLGELGYEMAQNNAAYILDDLSDSNDLFNVNGSLARALVGWKRSATQGHAAALVKVGDYHYYGHATEPDLAAAVQQYRLAADAREAQALFNLGVMHEYGMGLPADLHLAKRYYDSATEVSAEAVAPSTLALMILHSKLWARETLGDEWLDSIPQWLGGNKITPLPFGFGGGGGGGKGGQSSGAGKASSSGTSSSSSSSSSGGGTASSSGGAGESGVGGMVTDFIATAVNTGNQFTEFLNDLSVAAITMDVEAFEKFVDGNEEMLLTVLCVLLLIIVLARQAQVAQVTETERRLAAAEQAQLLARGLQAHAQATAAAAAQEEAAVAAAAAAEAAKEEASAPAEPQGEEVGAGGGSTLAAAAAARRARAVALEEQ